MDIPVVNKNHPLRNLRGVEAPLMFHNVPIQKTVEGNGISVGHNNVVFATSPNGALSVLPLNAVTRSSNSCKKLAAHPEGITDIQHSPFHHDLVASSGSGGEIHVSKLFTDLPQPSIESAWTKKAHTKKCVSVSWNPIADHVLASTGLDQVIKIWDLDTAKYGTTIPLLTNLWHAGFTQNGKLIAGMSHDSMIHIYDARTKELCARSPKAVFESNKPSQCTILASENGVDPNLVVAVGFDGMGKRKLKTFDIRDLGTPIQNTLFPGTSALTNFHYFPGNKVLFISAKGDSHITVLSVKGLELSLLPDATFPRACGHISFLPATSLDVVHTEVARCYRTEIEAKTINQMSFHCGKIDDVQFQPQYYGNGYISYTDPIPAEYWFNGGNSIPKLVLYAPADGSQVPLTEAKLTDVLRWDKPTASASELDASTQPLVESVTLTSVVASSSSQPPASPGELIGTSNAEEETPRSSNKLIDETVQKAMNSPGSTAPAGLEVVPTLATSLEQPNEDGAEDESVGVKCAKCLGCL